MDGSVPVEHVEQIALLKQWVAQKQRGVPNALRVWERQLLCWDAREALDREEWRYLRGWAEKAGLIERSKALTPPGQYRGEL